jgi:hypothetical protein
MKYAIVMNHPKHLINDTMTIALINNPKYQLEEEHINELQEWEGLSSG